MTDDTKWLDPSDSQPSGAAGSPLQTVYGNNRGVSISSDDGETWRPGVVVDAAKLEALRASLKRFDECDLGPRRYGNWRPGSIDHIMEVARSIVDEVQDSQEGGSPAGDGEGESNG